MTREGKSLIPGDEVCRGLGVGLAIDGTFPPLGPSVDLAPCSVLRLLVDYFSGHCWCRFVCDSNCFPLLVDLESIG